MSEVTPASGQPRPSRSCIASLASCSALGCRGSASQEASAFSSSGSRSVVSMYRPSPSAATMATAVASLSKARWLPTTASPNRRPSPCSASQPPSVPGCSASPRTSKPSSTSGSAEASVSKSRSRRTRNSRSSNSRWIWSRFHGCIRSVSGVCASGTSLTRSVSSRLSTTLDRLARSASPTLPLTLSTLSTRACSEPYSAIHLVAVFSPTPGMPGRLSLGSPRSAAKSGYWDGVSPYFSTTASGVNRVSSLTPLRGYSTVTSSLTSCRESRSPVTTSTR